MNNYFWKLKGIAKGVDPLDAVNEIERIRDIYGGISPEIIVNEAAKDDSPLHPIFEWDNNKAGYNYRIQQARILLNNVKLKVIANNEVKEISVYEVVNKIEGYKNIDSFVKSDIDFIKDSILSALNYWNNKLKTYKEFEKLREHIQQAIESIN